MKKILSLLLAAVLIASLLPLQPFATAQGTGINLVPDAASDAPNTFSTWWIQSAEQYEQSAKTGKTLTIRDVVSDEFLFNHEYGWAYSQYPSVRKDMIFVVCDGWELPDSQGDKINPDPYFGSQIFDEGKFPGYGDTPQERLKTYVDKVKAAGWKGAGLWICAQEDLANRPAAGYDPDFWTQRILWSKYAGISYWEIDWGTLYNNLEWRRFISDTVNELYPELVIEHITGAGGLNDENNSGRVTSAANRLAVQVAGFSDVFRTYDVTTQLTYPTTLERVGKLLRDGYTLTGDYLGLVCAEDQAYINASLGLTNMAFRSNRSATNTEETARALRWSRIAPAFEISAYKTTLSEESLDDYWNFRDGDTWYSNVNGKSIHQYAPAVISRGIGEAEVSVSDGLKPYVTASRNPNGAISVATHGRTQGRTHYYDIRADVTLPVGALTGDIGVFGYYKTLTLTFDTDISGKRILAQDLLANEAEDITSQVTAVDAHTLRFTGELLERIGLSAKSWSGETSQPGLVIRIGEPEDFAEAPAVGTRLNDPESIVPVFENASFEENAVGAIPGGWNYWRNTGTTDSTILTAAGGHTGDKACLISANVAHEGSIGQTFTGIPNGIYSASVWIKGTKNNGGINFSAVYGPGDYIAENLTAALGNGLSEWKKITLNNIVVKNGQIEIQVYFNASAGEKLWLDDFELTLLQQTGKQYTVTLFDSSNGTVIGMETVTAGETLPQPETPEKSGYTFLGWTVNGQPYDFSKPVNSNFVLTATWKNDNPDAEEKVNRPVWDMENLPDDMSSFVSTAWGEQPLGNFVDAIRAEGKGFDHSTALGYTYNKFTWDNGNNILQITLGSGCGADKYWMDGEMLWFWIDASEFITPLLLEVSLNWNSLAYGTHAYSWDGVNGIVDMGAMPEAWSGYTGASRVALKSGYKGWIGLPLAAYPNVNLADVNTLILYFEIAYDQTNLPKTAYFDNFWLTDFGCTPNVTSCKHTDTTVLPAAAPTCTECGLTEGLICADCGEVLTAQQEIPATGHNYENGICTTCGENEPETLKIKSAYLRLDEDIDIIYAATVPEDCTAPYMVFRYNGASFTVRDYTQEDGKYLFAFDKLIPSGMNDSISATLYAKKGGKTVSDTVDEYSVRTYCENLLAKTDDAKLTTLLSDLLTYGAAAQNYIGYKTDSLVTDGLDLTPSTFSTLEIKKATFSGEKSETADWNSAALILSDDLGLSFTFTAASVDGLSVDVTIGGRTQTFAAFEPEGDGKYAFNFYGIKATEFDDTVTASFKLNGETIGRTVSYSVNTYISSTQDCANEGLASFMKALYNYGASANSYSEK